MRVPPVVHNVRYESYACTTGGTQRAERDVAYQFICFGFQVILDDKIWN